MPSSSPTLTTGPSSLRNKQHEVETLIEGHTPHVLGLSEANFKAEHNLGEVQHSDYNFHTCPTLENSDLAISRVVVYTHQSLVVKRRHDLEDSAISEIWLELGLPQKKKIIVCNAYREWQHIGQLNSETGTVAAQLQRWCKFLDMWEKVEGGQGGGGHDGCKPGLSEVVKS